MRAEELGPSGEHTGSWWLKAGGRDPVERLLGRGRAGGKESRVTPT